MGTPRTKLAEYFQKLEDQDNYISLKTQMRRYNAQARGQKDTTNDAVDDREDMEYYEEMEGLNKLSESPLKGAYTKVMNPPKNSTNDSKTKEEKAHSTPVTTANDPAANLEVPKPEEKSQDTGKIDTPSA